MDNVCHTLVGGALARAGCDRLSPLALPTMLIAANLPDVDIISALWGDLAYLEYHRGVTHSVVGLLVEAPLLAGAMMLVDRVVYRKATERARARFWGLVVVALVGLASHLLLDWTNSYGVRPWLPFDGSWVYGDIVFVIDPWLWLMVGGALFLGVTRTRISMALWSVLFAAMAFGVIAQHVTRQAESGGYVAVWIWLGLLITLVVVRSVWPSLSARRLAIGSIVAVVAYWGTLAGLHRQAANLVADSESPGVTATVSRGASIPTFMRPDRWIVLRATDADITESTVTLATRPFVRSDVIRRNLDDPAVSAALLSCPGVVAEGFNRFLYAEIERNTPAGECTVLLRDARFGGIPGRYGFATTHVVIDANMQYVPDGRPCPRVVVRRQAAASGTVHNAEPIPSGIGRAVPHAEWGYTDRDRYCGAEANYWCRVAGARLSGLPRRAPNPAVVPPGGASTIPWKGASASIFGSRASAPSESIRTWLKPVRARPLKRPRTSFGEHPAVQRPGEVPFGQARSSGLLFHASIAGRSEPHYTKDAA